MQIFYTVRPGESLQLIAQRWKLPIPSLIAANRLVPPYTIFPGQQLSMPPGVDLIRVNSGDTLYRLSQQYGIPLPVIIEANRLSPPYRIEVGQLLRIPPGVPYYTVRPGDTLYSIASKYNVITAGQIRPELIQQQNQLPSSLIYPGMHLIIPYAPPGDPGWIAYTSDRSGSYDIWLYRPFDGLNIPLTQNLGEEFSVPYWSPDSGRIAFIGKRGILYVIEIVTGATAQIDQIEPYTLLDWSPDSQSLSYMKQDQIVLYHTVTHQVRTIRSPGATDVQWFPSGRELLFQAPDSAGVSQLFKININGTEKRQVTQNTEGPLHDIRLSPDGTFALFTSPGVSISIISTINLTTGQTHTLQGGPLAKNYFPAWSPDSSLIAYSATASSDTGYYSLIETDARTGGNRRTWALSECFGTPVTWSPRGDKIVYLSGCRNQESSSQIWLVDINHPVPILLVTGGRITAVQWSPLTTDSFKVYRSTKYHVSFSYPASWQPVSEERAEGVDGFFQVSAISSDEELSEVCRSEAFHRLRPYGSQPQIISTKVQNQEACFIYPSSDQPIEMKKQAALIARYPRPIQIQGTTYPFFVLWADRNHIDQIVRSLSWI